MIAGALAFVTGIGLMVLPEAFAFAAPAADLLQVVGPIAAAAGFVSMTEVTRGVRRVNALSALVVWIGAFVVGLEPLGIALVWVAGAILAVTSFIGSSMPAARYGGGWGALLDRG